MKYLAILTILLTPCTASAHTLRTNNGVSVELHIDPNDAPTAGQTSLLAFEIGSQEPNMFDVTHCVCTVTITNGSKTLLSQSLKTSGNADLTLPFTFPAKGMYTVTLHGAPINESFNEFTVKYPVNVIQNIMSHPSRSDSIQIIGGIVAGLLLAGSILRFKRS